VQATRIKQDEKSVCNGWVGDVIVNVLEAGGLNYETYKNSLIDVCTGFHV
jgi:hypothetical protein